MREKTGYLVNSQFTHEIRIWISKKRRNLAAIIHWFTNTKYWIFNGQNAGTVNKSTSFIRFILMIGILYVVLGSWIAEIFNAERWGFFSVHFLNVIWIFCYEFEESLKIFRLERHTMDPEKPLHSRALSSNGVELGWLISVSFSSKNNNQTQWFFHWLNNSKRLIT